VLMDSPRDFVVPIEITVGGKTVALRTALRDDVPEIVALLAADDLGAARDGFADDAELEPYLRAFDAIERDPAHVLLVGQHAAHIVATLQLSVLPGLAHRGAQRAQIEAVRVDERFRGTGLGSALFAWAVDAARLRGCALVQLTSDKSRIDAHRFYEHLGFTASHEGFKLFV
jgi:GNAT superfamily N-acetyltransferase